MNGGCVAGVDPDEIIVVTGMGAVSAAGDQPAKLWESVASGCSPAAWFADPTVANSPSIPACVIPGLPDEAHVLPQSRKMDRCVQLALAAASQAVCDAQLLAHPRDQARMGIVVGSSRGPIHKWTETLELLSRGRRLPPTLAANSTPGCLSGALMRSSAKYSGTHNV